MPNAYELAECHQILNRNGHAKWRIATTATRNRNSIQITDQKNRIVTILEQKRNGTWQGRIPATPKAVGNAIAPELCWVIALEKGADQERRRPANALRNALDWIARNPKLHRPHNPQEEHNVLSRYYPKKDT